LEEFYAYCPEYADVKKVVDDRWAFRPVLNEARKQKLGDGVKYYKEGSTVYCWFNSFMCDDSGWRKFYKGEGPKPTVEDYPNDWLIAFVDALEKAENDPEVKNFVLDISTNGGGSTDVVAFITSIFCNKADIYYENTLTGQRMKCSYDVDRNLDGKFDALDEEVKYHLNFALLTSSFSFSCGNLLPALLKDYGIPIIGKRSGGGSCCILYNPSADGFGYRYSTHKCRLTDTKGINIEPGIEPNYELDINDFFDIQKVGQLIESYYSK
jgi:C-terminal processing protease CtpA/Prc